MRTKNNLKEFRLLAGYTQEEAADLIGLSSSNRISEWEKGTSEPGITNLFKLCTLYKSKPQELYDESYKDIRRNIRRKKHDHSETKRIHETITSQNKSPSHWQAQ